MKRLFKKAIRDLFLDKRRAVMSLLAILIGTMSFGLVTFCYEIISRELVSVYDAINPASGSLEVDRIDDELIALTKAFDGIEIFEQKAYSKLRVQTGESEWKTLELFAVKDFSAMEINKITSEKGSFRPEEGEALLERDAVKVAGAGIGDTLVISLHDGSTKELVITGIVADIGLHPATAHDTVYAYISYDTLQNFGLTGNKIDFIITGSKNSPEEKYDRERILSISNVYIKMLEENGYTVTNLEVSDTPGLSMHLEEYKSALFLLQIFSFVTFLFGCMIMSGLISSIISGQTRQIGILKGVGADTGKIMGSYMLAFFVLIILTTAVSLCLSTFLAGGLSSALMSLGNMRPADTSVPGYLYGMYCALALLVPVIAAFFPIRRGVGISVKDAVNYYGVNLDNKAIKLPKPKFLSRPVLLSLRNALCRKSRFLRNVATLSVAGAMFVSVVTSMISIQTTLSDNLDSWKFDYHFITNTVYEDEELKEIMVNVPAVAGYENWGSSSGMLVHDNGEIVNSYTIVSPPRASVMIEPEMLAGRWLTDEDSNQIVVSHKFFLSEPDYQIGDRLTLQIGGQVQDFIIVGSMRDFGATAIYMSENGYEQFVPTADRLSNIKLVLNFNGLRKTVYKATELALKEQGILILQSQSKSDLNAIAAGHFAVTLQTFLFIICMLVIVSGFGLAATMNVQTAERTKEIGIMKAMGADRKQITDIVTSESLLISLISWIVSVALGIPLSVLGVYVFGNLVIETPLQFSIVSLMASYIIWLILTIAVGRSASRSCGKRAANMSVKDSLAFE